MNIGNGNSFRDMLMNSPGTCPNCNASLTLAKPPSWRSPKASRTTW